MADDRPIQHFPDTYSIKAVGIDRDEFAEFAVNVVKTTVALPNSVAHTTRASSAGKYLSVTISFEATSQEELDRVFTKMSSQERVVWVL